MEEFIRQFGSIIVLLIVGFGIVYTTYYVIDVKFGIKNKDDIEPIKVDLEPIIEYPIMFKAVDWLTNDDKKKNGEYNDLIYDLYYSVDNGETYKPIKMFSETVFQWDKKLDNYYFNIKDIDKLSDFANKFPDYNAIKLYEEEQENLLNEALGIKKEKEDANKIKEVALLYKLNS